jgi:uncharacterized protein YbaR (Trm112 family)
MITTYFCCPSCEEQIEADVDIGEHMVEHEEYCEDCGHIFTDAEKLEIYSEALEDAAGTAVDRAMDYGQDR